MLDIIKSRAKLLWERIKLISKPPLDTHRQDQSKTSNGADRDLQRFQQEIRDARELLEFAIAQGRPVDDETVNKIKGAKEHLRAPAKWPDPDERSRFERTYRDLAKFMDPINIHTLHATSDTYKGRRWKVWAFGQRASDAKIWSRKLWSVIALCMFLILLGEKLESVLTSYYPSDEETTGVRRFHIISYTANKLLPFLYGLLGALTYLLRSAHEYIIKRSFDLNRIPEYYNRMLLGLISGGVILLFVDPQTSMGATKIGASALAFLVGYNTDYLFNTIERFATAVFPKVSLTVNPAAPAPGVVKVSLSPEVVYGGEAVTGTVTLSGPAPDIGVVVSLSAPGGIPVPPSVTVQPGQTSANFTFTSMGGTSVQTAAITASANGSSAGANLTVHLPLVVKEVSLDPPRLPSKPGTAKGRVTLNEAVPIRTVTVELDPDKKGCEVKPSKLTISTGQKTGDFTVDVLQTASAGTVTITAKLNNKTEQAELVVP